MTEELKLTFLGTSSAVPTARRNHPALLLKFKNENILFDCGEGTQRQFRKAKLNPCKTTRIFITHWHGDHTLGIPGLLETLIMNGYNGTLKIYGPKGTKKRMDEIMNFHLKWYLQNATTEQTNLKIEINELKSGEQVDEKEFKIEAQNSDHQINSLSYSFTIKEKQRLDKNKLKKLKVPNGPLLGELAKGKTIKHDGKKIDGSKLLYKEEQRKVTILSDTRYQKTLEKFAKNSEILICEATYSEDEQEIANEHYHMTSKQTGELAKKSKSKKLFLTHLSQRYDTKKGEKQILNEAKKVFKNTEIAEDLMSLKL